MTKTELISDPVGQDGAHLAELQLEKGRAVHGIKRRASLAELASEMVRTGLRQAQGNVLRERQGPRLQIQRKAAA